MLSSGALKNAPSSLTTKIAFQFASRLSTLLVETRTDCLAWATSGVRIDFWTFAVNLRVGGTFLEMAQGQASKMISLHEKVGVSYPSKTIDTTTIYRLYCNQYAI
jgi:hypothetical protein